MKFHIAAAATLAATVLLSQPARATMIMEVEAFATGTTDSFLCDTGPGCAVSSAFAASFRQNVSIEAFVNGSAFFQSGANSNAGLISGTVLDLGGGQFTGVDFRYDQSRVCTRPPCNNVSTSLTAGTFNVRQIFPSVPPAGFGVSNIAQVVPSMSSAVPEPGTWATMLIGFGAIGGVMRRGRRTGALAAA